MIDLALARPSLCDVCSIRCAVESVFLGMIFRYFRSAPIVGHAGDGNFHVFYLIDPAVSHTICKWHQITTEH